jgi:UDP-N-acetylmuramate dehydrogenase
MKVFSNVSLKSMHSFGNSVFARDLVEINTLDDLKRFSPIKSPFLILGGGSNVLFTKDYEGIVLKNNIKGIELIHENAEEVYVKAGGGEIWDDLVGYTVNKGWGGLENLTYIPGTVGAAPMQNIGAYGVEQENCFHALEAFELESGIIKTFTREACEFGYRESIFKGRLRDKYFILNVTYRLRKHPILHLSYGAIQQKLREKGILNPIIKDIADAVKEIRKSKLPEVGIIGSAGSFFKNPVVPASQCIGLTQQFPEIPYYPQSGAGLKLAAGWLIDQCGWKGYRKGDAGCYPLQALVLVNYGEATGAEILNLSDRIIESVFQKFGILLEKEVNVY